MPLLKDQRIGGVNIRHIVSVGAFFVFLAFLALFNGGEEPRAQAATSPTFMTYQGRVRQNDRIVSSTLSMKILLYDAATNGSILYTASGTIGDTRALSVTPSADGFFSIDLGGTSTNSLDPTIFQSNQGIYLEVQIGAETLTPRRQITAAPFAFNARYLDGVAATSTASTSTYIPVSDSHGNFNFNRVTSTGVVVTASSTFATTTFTGSLTVLNDAQIQAIRDGLGWVQNQGAAERVKLGLNNGGFGSGATPNNLTMSTSSFSFFDLYLVTSTVQGLRAGIFDGRYIYMAPGANASMNFVRFDTTKSFSATSSWDFMPRSETGSITQGFNSASFDGRYIYFVPQNGIMVRYDTTGTFTDSNSWSTFDLTQVDAGTTLVVSGSGFDGRYLYVLPSTNNGVTDTYILRYDTTQSFIASSWSSFDYSQVHASAGRHISGPIFDGRYIYLIPYGATGSSGITLRYDTTLTFENSSSWKVIDLSLINSAAVGFVGGAFDGRYVYYIPNSNGALKSGLFGRYDTAGSFDSTSSWKFFDTSIESANAKGFVGAVFDGRYLYAIPWLISNGVNTTLSRYDTANSFTVTSSWSFFVTSNLHASSTYHWGGVFDGHYIYMMPTGVSSNAGLITRLTAYSGGIDTTHSVAKLARGKDLYVTSSSTVMIGTSTIQGANGTYQLFVDAGASTSPGLGVNGFIRASGFISSSTTLDLAETYPINYPSCKESDSCPEAGDVVCLSSTGDTVGAIEKCGSNQAVIGIVSTDPGVMLGGFQTEYNRHVALAGRVPVKVTGARGPIKRGDKLALSSLRGVAEKATGKAETFAVALEDYNAPGIGEIIAFVQRGVVVESYVPPTVDEAGSSLTLLARTFIASIYKALRYLGLTIEDGILHLREMIVGNVDTQEVHTNQLCVGATCVGRDEITQALYDRGLEGQSNSTTVSSGGDLSEISTSTNFSITSSTVEVPHATTTELIDASVLQSETGTTPQETISIITSTES